MFEWIANSIIDHTSPILLSREIFQNLVAAVIGAFFSAALVAPMTARWITWEAQRKWRPARRVALKDLAVWIELYARAHVILVRSREEESEVATLEGVAEALRSLLTFVESFEGTYAKWAEIWTVEMNAAILAIIEHAQYGRSSMPNLKAIPPNYSISFQASIIDEIRHYSFAPARSAAERYENIQRAMTQFRLDLPAIDLANLKVLYSDLQNAVDDSELRPIIGRATAPLLGLENGAVNDTFAKLQLTFLRILERHRPAAGET